MAELPQIALPQANRIEIRTASPSRRLMAKLAAIVTTTVATIAASSTGPEATSARS